MNPLGLFQRALVVAVVTDLAVAACGGVILAVMVDLAAIIEFHLGVSRYCVMLEGSLIALSAVDMLHGAVTELLVVSSLVGDAAIGAFLSGHGMSLEGMGFLALMAEVPLRGKERCFALRRATSG